MGKLLQSQKLLRLNHEEIDNLHTAINSNDIESVMKACTTRKNPRPDDFTGGFYQMFQEEFIPLLLKLFQKHEKKEILSNSLYEDIYIKIGQRHYKKRKPHQFP